MTIAETIATPVLIGPVPPKKQLSLFKFLKVVRENFMAAIPITAYEQPISAMKFGIGHVVLVADPDGVKRVLLDNVANYPKADMEKRMLGAALGEGLLVSDGEKWRSHRRLMAPSFDHKSIVSYAPGMVESAAHWLESWDNAGTR